MGIPSLRCLLPLRRQRPHLPGHLGPPVRQRFRQHRPFGVARRRDVHARARRRQLCWLESGPIAADHAAGPRGCCAPTCAAEAGARGARSRVVAPRCRGLPTPSRAGRRTRTGARRLARALHRLSHAVHAARSPSCLLTPVTVTMGGTLTLLIRHLVRVDVARQRLADRAALRRQHRRRRRRRAARPTSRSCASPACRPRRSRPRGSTWPRPPSRRAALRGAARYEPALGSGPAGSIARHGGCPQRHAARRGQLSRCLVPAAALASACPGVAVMGMEMLWLRHFSILLGGFRAVFSLVLALCCWPRTGAGALAGGWLLRRVGGARRNCWWRRRRSSSPPRSPGLAAADAGRRWPPTGRAIAATLAALGRSPACAGRARGSTCDPMLLEVGLPALLPGCRFRWRTRSCSGRSSTVGRRAGPAVPREHGRRGGRFARRRVTCCCRGSACRPRRPCSRSLAAAAILPLLAARAPRAVPAVARGGAVAAVARRRVGCCCPPTIVLRRARRWCRRGDRVLAHERGARPK